MARRAAVQSGTQGTPEIPSAVVRLAGWGFGLLLLAFGAWNLREAVPSWLAANVTASAEFATTAERDDARAFRAFEAVRGSFAADAILEALPNTGRVRHTRLTVMASDSAQAVDLASRMADAMQKAFAREGDGEFLANVRKRTEIVPDRTTDLAGQALRGVAAVTALCGAILLVIAAMRVQAGAERVPPPVLWGVAFSLAVPFMVWLLPGPVAMGLFFMAIPGFIAGLILWKTRELRHAASWPSTRGTITRSQLRADRNRFAGSVTQVRNIADIEFEFTLGDRVIKGHRIGIGESPDNIEAVLEHYRVGTTVPVYYDPEDPENAVLERDAPVSVGSLYAIAAGVLLVGVAVLVLFWNISAVFEIAAAYFPENAFLPGVAFFGLGGLMLVVMLWAARRQAAEAARWPQVAGHILSSTVEHYRQRVGGGTTGSVSTFYEPVIEYAYSVGGRDYHGTRLSFGGRTAGARSAAEAFAARYPEGRQVTVHYDPRNPAIAVLEVRVAHALMLGGLALAFFGVAFLFSGFLR